MVTRFPDPLEQKLSLCEHPGVRHHFDIIRLKLLPRTGWVRRGIESGYAETVASHIIGVESLVHYFVGESFPEIDMGRAIDMAWVHDQAEAYTGDPAPGDMGAAEKVERERSALRSVLSGFSRVDHYLACWEEFERNETPTAQLLKQCDILDPTCLAVVYEHHGNEAVVDFYPDAQRRITLPPVRRFLDAALLLRPTL